MEYKTLVPAVLALSLMGGAASAQTTGVNAGGAPINRNPGTLTRPGAAAGLPSPVARTPGAQLFQQTNPRGFADQPAADPNLFGNPFGNGFNQFGQNGFNQFGQNGFNQFGQNGFNNGFNNGFGQNGFVNQFGSSNFVPGVGGGYYDPYGGGVYATGPQYGTLGAGAAVVPATPPGVMPVLGITSSPQSMPRQRARVRVTRTTNRTPAVDQTALKAVGRLGPDADTNAIPPADTGIDTPGSGGATVTPAPRDTGVVARAVDMMASDRALVGARVTAIKPMGVFVRYRSGGRQRSTKLGRNNIFLFGRNGEMVTAARSPRSLRVGQQVMIPDPQAGTGRQARR